MSNQIVITSGAKLRDLDDVIIGTDGILSSLAFNVANGVPRLDENGKILVSQLPNSVMEFKGVWNAATNTPTLANGTGNAGDVWLCNVAGTVNFGAGPIAFAVGDYAVYTGTVWARSSGATGTVTSVGVSRDGNALVITGSPVTSSGTINLGFSGNSSQYINGAGNLTTFPTIITQATTLVTEVYNETGATLTKGTIVYINGGHGNLPTVTKAIATSDATSAQTYGVINADLTNMNNGYVTVIGSLGDLDTQAYANGTQLYLSGTTAGAWTSTKPSAPIHLVYVGIVVRSHPTQGVVEIKIQNGYELNELHDVQIIDVANNDGIFYDSATSLWKNKTIGEVLGYTPANNSEVVHLAGTETITGAKTFSGYTTFTSTVDLTNGLTFRNSGYSLLLQPPTLSVNRTVTLPNGTGTLALTSDISYPVTSVFGRTGAVVAVSGDYNTDQVTEGTTNLYFTNARARAAISLTTTGSTGAATYNNTTGVLNIPNYADQYVGTVTSVALSAPTGFSVSGSPVTSSGTLALAFATGYSLPTNIKQSNWDDAYTWVAAFPTQTGNSGKFLTTDGSTLSWAANPLGTVTSVAMTVPTGLSISGSPITTSGTLAVTLTAGYSIPTTASQTNWDTAYTNRITSLTTTGSSGSSTLVSNTLNIPTYTLAGLGGQPLATNLTSLAGLTYASTSFVKMTAAGTFSLDTNTYALNSALASYLPLAGGTMSGSITYSGSLLKDLSVTSRASIIINWAGAGYFGLGPNGSHIIRLDQADPTTGAWENATDVVLQLGNNKTVLANTDIGVTVQAKLTNPITGTGSTNKIARFSGSTTLVDSYISDAAGNPTIINKDASTIASALLSIAPATSTNASTLNLDNAGAGSFYVGRQNSAGNSSLISSLDTYASVIGHTSNQTLHLVTASLSRLAIDGSGNSVFAGSLRLGGSTTAKQFVVNQGGTSGYLLSGEVSGTEIAYWYYSASEVQLSSKSSTRALLFLTSDSTRMTISSGGYIGINQAPNTDQLSVTGTASNWAGSFSASTTTGSSYGAIVRGGTNSSDVAFRVNNAANTLTYFTVNGNGNINIGYGTATDSKLGIYVSSSFTTRGAFASSALNLYDPTTVGVYSQITFGYEAGRTYAAAYMGYLSTNSTGGGYGDLVFGTRSTYDVQPTERFRVLSSGPMLINTSSGVTGGGTLQVNGNVNINGVFQINGVTIGGGGGSGVTGSGTTNYIPKWTGSSTLGNSIIQDNGSTVTMIGGVETVARFATSGDGTIIIGGNAAQGVSSGEQYITYQNGTTNTNAWMVGMDDGEDWRFAYGAVGEITDANSLIKLTQGGNFIIGQPLTDNGSKLQVYGDLYVSGSSVYAGGVTYSGTQTFNGLVYLNSTTTIATYQNLIWKGVTGTTYDFSMGNGGYGMYILSAAEIDLNAPIGQRYGLFYTFKGNGSSAYNVNIFNSGVTADELQFLGGLKLTTTTCGFTVPRMTQTQRDALSGSVKVAGTIIFNTSNAHFEGYNGSSWQFVG